jgi:hypothetical protein
MNTIILMQNTHDYNVIRSEIEELPSPPAYQLLDGPSPSPNILPQGRGNSVCTTTLLFKEGGFWLAMAFLTGAKYRR